MKKVDLSKLPKKEGFGANKGKEVVDWQKSIGYKVSFIYEDIEGELTIKDYDGRFLEVIIEVDDYNYENKKISTDGLSRCKLGGILKCIKSKYEVKIGQTLKDEARNLTITDIQIRNNNGQNKKWYKYTCNKCGWTEGWIVKSDLNRGRGCSCCVNRTAVLGINTIYDTDSWMMDLGISEGDAKKYTRGSNNKINVKCPNCKKEKDVRIIDVYKYKSIGCICGDGFSYPEKFMANVLTQLDIEFQTQYSPYYLGRKLSDFYIPNINIVIETDGGLCHKGGKTHGKSKRSISEYIEIDEWKDEQHKLHGVETIRINCFESDMEYIKNNILKSKLNEIFNLSNINWIQADLYATKSNKIKEVCEYWNNKEEWETTISMSLLFNTSKTTINNYLKKGVKLGWCNYNAKQEYLNTLDKNHKSKMRSVKCLEDGKVFESVVNASRYYGVSASCISAICLNKRKTTKGRSFKYI